MAINVYMTLFRRYNAQQLKALEWRYHCMVRIYVSSFGSNPEFGAVSLKDVLCECVPRLDIPPLISNTDPDISISAMEDHS